MLFWGGGGVRGGASPENTSKYFTYIYCLSAGFVEGFEMNKIVKGGGRVELTALFHLMCNYYLVYLYFISCLCCLYLTMFLVLSLYSYFALLTVLSLCIYIINHFVYLYSFIAAYFFSGWSVSAYCTI